MSDRSPKSLWDRLWRTFEGWMDSEGEGEADEGSLAFLWLFVAPLFLAFVFLLRR